MTISIKPSAPLAIKDKLIEKLEARLDKLEEKLKK